MLQKTIYAFNSHLLSRLLALFIFYCGTVLAFDPVILVFGSPGSGKGTFSQYFREYHQYLHISAGDLVRREIKKQTPIGSKIANAAAKGERVNPEIMQFLITREVIECKNKERPFIIDGVCRTDDETAFLHKLLEELGLSKQVIAIFFSATDSICSTRMYNRLVCSHCNHIYNLITDPPKKPEQCDFCMHRVTKRSNDTPEIIEKKIQDYRQNVEAAYKKATQLYPCLDYCVDKSLDVCRQFYGRLVKHISQSHCAGHDFVNYVTLRENQ